VGWQNQIQVSQIARGTNQVSIFNHHYFFPLFTQSYRIDESDKDKNERLQNWESFLGVEVESKKEIAASSSSMADNSTAITTENDDKQPEVQPPQNDNADSKIDES
jgi:hypothetical protein